jgi:hypothetical protein
LLLGCVVVALVAHDLAAGAVGVALMSLSLVLVVMFGGSAGLLPRGTALRRSERRILGFGLLAVLVLGLGVLVAIASGALTASTLLVPGALSLVLGGIALRIALS